MSYKRIIWDRFDGGMDTTIGRGKLVASACRDNKNLLADRGILRLVKGPSTLFPTRANPVTGFTRYAGSAGRFLVLTQGNGSTLQDIFSLNEATGTFTDIGGSLSPTVKPFFIQYGETLYISDSNSTLQLWTGTGTVQDAGVLPPSSAATISDAGSGNLNNAATGIRYRYYYTLENSRGIESNPSPVSNELDAVNRQIQVSIGTFPQTNITHVRIYREGGNLSSPYMVAREANTGAAPFTYTDNRSDQAVIDDGIQLEFDHDYPPGGFSVMALHQGRIFGAGHVILLIDSPSRLWYSGRDNPEYFPLSPEEGGDSGGYLDIDGVYNDAIVCLSSTGSLLLVGREKTIYLLYGNKFENFKFILHANIGAAGPRSAARVENTAALLCRDKMLYLVENNGLAPLSRQIEKDLQEVDDTRLDDSVLAYHEGRVYLFFPKSGADPAIGWVYDFRNKGWTNLTDVLHDFTSLHSLPPADGIGANELLGAVSPGYSIGGAGYNGIVKLFDEENGEDLSARLLTTESDAGSPVTRKRAAEIRVYGKSVGAVGLTATVSAASTRNGITSQALAITNEDGLLLRSRLGANLVGEFLQAEIEGDATELEIESIELDYCELDTVR